MNLPVGRGDLTGACLTQSTRPHRGELTVIDLQLGLAWPRLNSDLRVLSPHSRTPELQLDPGSTGLFHRPTRAGREDPPCVDM